LKFNPGLAKLVENAFSQSRSASIEFPNPSNGILHRYEFDFSSNPMSQYNASTEIPRQIRRNELGQLFF
jgi:hypothetical protein